MNNYYSKMVNNTISPLNPVGPLSPKGTKIKKKSVLNHTILEEANLNATMFPLPEGNFLSPRQTLSPNRSNL
jgi:hypothetical protein